MSLTTSKLQSSEPSFAFSKFAQAFLRFYPVALSVFGTACLTVSGYSLVSHRSLWLCGAALALLVGSTILVKEVAKVGSLRQENSHLSKRLSAQKERRVFLISASLADDEWQSEFIQGLLFGLINKGYEATVYVPGQHFQGAEQDGHMRMVLLNRHEYVGGILISMFSEARKNEIKTFANVTGLPLVIHDNI